MAEIKQAIKEADAGDFAAEAEVNAERAKWSANARYAASKLELGALARKGLKSGALPLLP